MKRSTKYALAALASAAYLSAMAAGAAAQPATGDQVTPPVPAPHSPQDNGAVKEGPAIAPPQSAMAPDDRDRRNTDTDNEATSSPGQAGPVESGKHAPPASRKPSITNGGLSGGVQNPHLGTGINGAPRNE